jgi:dihydrofolate synthase/folylpolyglutamate synthase
MADKDLAAMLPRMLPLVDAWYLCDLPTPRAASAAQLQARLEAASAQASPARTLAPVHCHGNPRAALEAALAAAESADRIVVFGSFYTVGGVLQGGLPRRVAPHLSR